MKHMLKGIKIEFVEHIIIYYDNTSTISMSKNPILNSKTKHISNKYHVLGEKVLEKESRLKYVSIKDKIAYIFTIFFPKYIFEYLRGILGVMLLPNSK